MAIVKAHKKYLKNCQIFQIYLVKSTNQQTQISKIYPNTTPKTKFPVQIWDHYQLVRF